MRRAAFGLAVVARRTLAASNGHRVALLVGAGDNGGDALWAGAELRRRGIGVTAVLLDPQRAHAGGLAALRWTGGRARRRARRRRGGRSADLVLDGIVGLSGRGPLRPAAAELVDVADAGSVPVLAVDSPSGVDPDTGTADGPAVTAAATVTFGALKPVHVLAAHRCGPVELVDIGLGPELPDPHAVVLGEADAAARWPVPGPADDKYTQGVGRGSRPDRRPTRVRPCSRRVPPCSRPAAWCATADRRPISSARGGRRSSPPTSSPMPRARSRGRSTRDRHRRRRPGVARSRVGP